MNDERGFFDVAEPPQSRVLALPGGDIVVLPIDLAHYATRESGNRPGDGLLRAFGLDPTQIHRPPLLTGFGGGGGVLQPPRRHDGANEPGR